MEEESLEKEKKTTTRKKTSTTKKKTTSTTTKKKTSTTTTRKPRAKKVENGPSKKEIDAIIKDVKEQLDKLQLTSKKNFVKIEDEEIKKFVKEQLNKLQLTSKKNFVKIEDEEIKKFVKEQLDKLKKPQKNEFIKIEDEESIKLIKEQLDKIKIAPKNKVDKDDNNFEVVENTVQAVADTVTAPVKEMVSGDLRKKPSIIIYLLILFLIAFMVLVGVFAYYQRKVVDKKGTFITIGEYDEKLIPNDYYRVSSDEILKSIFPNKNINGTDFDKYDYVILGVNYDECSESNLNPVGYTENNGTLLVDFEYEASCGVCAPTYIYYLLELEKNVQYNDIKINYEATNNPHCIPDVAYKPIIYFYPKSETNVTVKLGNPEIITTSYPKYINEWNVKAYPNGTLKDSNNREYYGLFWEGENHKATVHKDGFVVRGENTITFLESKLKTLGLTDKEANEFIIYWLPKLENNKYNYIYFETMKEINEYMPLEITPKPDTVIRIQMDYKPLEDEIKVSEQKLTSPTRNGFTVVEWGGSIIKD